MAQQQLTLDSQSGGVARLNWTDDGSEETPHTFAISLSIDEGSTWVWSNCSPCIECSAEDIPLSAGTWKTRLHETIDGSETIYVGPDVTVE